MDPIHLLWFDWSHVWFDPVYTRACSREGSGKGVRITEGKLWHRVLQSYTGKSPAAINVLAVLVRVGNQLSRSLLQFMVEYVETRQISFPFAFEAVFNEPKKTFDYLVKFFWFNWVPRFAFSILFFFPFNVYFLYNIRTLIEKWIELIIIYYIDK